MRDMEKMLRQEELQVAVRRSIMTEKNAMDFYSCAGERMVNERARLTFHLLAKEERAHARTFYDAYRGDDLPPFDELMAAPPDTGSEWWQSLHVCGGLDDSCGPERPFPERHFFRATQLTHSSGAKAHDSLSLATLPGNPRFGTRREARSVARRTAQ